MSWFGDVESELKEAAKEVNEFPKNSLGWLVAAQKWNHWANEAVSEGNKWSDTGLPDDQLPTNCDIEKDEETPLILIPNFDKNQVLKV